MSGGPKYRVALVGCGDIAEHGHLPALMAHPRFQLAVLCDVRKERAELLSKRAGGVPVCSDYRTLPGRGGLDAVILALHPEVSVAPALAFLRAGLPVLDEKPLATGLEDGRRLKSAVEETRGVYQIGFVMRYTPLVEHVALFARRIGAPALCRVGIFDERLDRTRTEHFERIQQIMRHSSAVTHEGSHVVDYARSWLPAPWRRVHAVAVKTEADFSGPNLWHAQFSAGDGSVFQLEIGWHLPESPRSAVRIIGPGGCLELDFRSGTGAFRQGGQTETVRVPPMRQEWAAQLDRFAEAIERKQAQAASVRDGLRALAATQACEESWRSGRAVEIEASF